MKHVRGAIVCLAALLWSAVLCAGEVEDGLYAWRMDGRGPRMTRDDGVEVALVHRVGSAVGEATLTSISNDNSEFVLCLRGIKLTTPKADTSDVALVVAGMCLRVSENSDKDRPEGRIDVTGRIHSTAAARKLAGHFQVRPNMREHPGHQFTIRWLPERESYLPGAPVTLLMVLRNTGTEPFSFREGGQQRGPRDNQFRFLAYRGYSGCGPAVRDIGDPTNFGGIMTIRTLKPGETFQRSVPLDRWFKFKEPGYYRVTGLYQLELHGPSGDYSPIWDDFGVGECLVKVVAEN